MEMDSEDLSLKFRMTGAFVWLLLLIIIVPTWYSHPVGFSPDMELTDSHQKNDQIVVDKPFVLPGANDTSHGQQAQEINAAADTSAPTVPEKKSVDKASVAVQTTKTTNAVTKKSEQKLPAKTAEKPKTPVLNEKWIIRVAAYRSKEKANLLYEHLKYDYDVFVKYFPQSKYYSVRIGPYTDKSLALRDQQQLNRVLRIHSELAKTK